MLFFSISVPQINVPVPPISRIGPACFFIHTWHMRCKFPKSTIRSYLHKVVAFMKRLTLNGSPKKLTVHVLYLSVGNQYLG